MDIKREGVAKKKMIKRIIYVVIAVIARHGRRLADQPIETRRAHGGVLNTLARYGEARPHGP